MIFNQAVVDLKRAEAVLVPVRKDRSINPVLPSLCETTKNAPINQATQHSHECRNISVVRLQIKNTMIKSIDTSRGKLHAADLNHALVELTDIGKPATRLIYFAKYQGPDLEVEIDADAHDILSDSPVVPYQRYAKVLLWVVINRETACDVYCVDQPGNKYEYSKVTTIDGFHAESIGCSITSAIFLVGESKGALGKVVAFEYGKDNSVRVDDVNVAVASTSGHGIAFEAKNPISDKINLYYVTDTGERWLLYGDQLDESTAVEVVTVEKDTYKNRLELKSRFYGDFLLIGSVDEDDISPTVRAVLDLRTGADLLRRERAPSTEKVTYEVGTFEGMLHAKIVGTDENYIYHESKWRGPFFELANFIYGVVGFTKSGTCELIYYEK